MLASTFKRLARGQYINNLQRNSAPLAFNHNMSRLFSTAVEKEEVEEAVAEVEVEDVLDP